MIENRKKMMMNLADVIENARTVIADMSENEQALHLLDSIESVAKRRLRQGRTLRLDEGSGRITNYICSRILGREFHQVAADHEPAKRAALEVARNALREAGF